MSYPLYKTLERWIKEEKEKGSMNFLLKVKYSVVPGRIKIPGVRNYIWNANVFHLDIYQKINGIEKPVLQGDQLIFVNINQTQKELN